MSLLQIMMQRGGMPSANEAQRIKAGGELPPMRGFMPWSSGFEGTQKQMLEEMMRAMAMRSQTPEQNLKRLIPLLMGKR